MSTLMLKIGDLCEIVTEKYVYLTKIQDVIDDEHYTVDCPLRNGTLEFFHSGDTFKLSVYRDDGAGSMYSYQFDAIVENRRIAQDNVRLPVLDVKRTSEVEKTQRRNFFRVTYDAPILVTQSDEIKKKTLEFDGNIVDISGGGIKIISENRMPKGTVNLAFELLDTKFILEAELISCDYIKEHKYFVARYKYNEIAKDVQDKLINRLTKIQSNFLKNSMLRYESQNDANMLKEGSADKFVEEELFKTRIVGLKAFNLVMSFISFIMYLFTLPATSYPLDKLFGINQRTGSITDSFYTYTSVAALISICVSISGLIWYKYRKNRIGIFNFFILNILVAFIFLYLSLSRI